MQKTFPLVLSATIALVALLPTATATCFFAPEFCTCRHAAPSGTCYKSNGDGSCRQTQCQASWKCDCLSPTHMCRRGVCTRFLPIPGATVAPGVDVRCHKVENATCVQSKGTNIGMIGTLTDFSGAIAASPAAGGTGGAVSAASPSPSAIPSASWSPVPSSSSSPVASTSSSPAASTSSSPAASTSSSPAASTSSSPTPSESTVPSASSSASAVPSPSSVPSASPTASQSMAPTPSVSTTPTPAVPLSGLGGPCNSINDCLQPPTPLGIACILNKCKEIGKCDAEMNTYCESRQSSHTCCEAMVDCGLYNLDADAALCGRDCTASCTGFNGYQACAFKSAGANLLVSISTAQYQALIPPCPVVA